MANERVELQVLVSQGRDGELLPLIQSWWKTTPEMAMPPGTKLRDDNYLTVGAATGRNSPMLRQVCAELPAFLRCMRARFKVVDGPSHGHISIDYLRVAVDSPGAMHEPVWGFGDYHTHPMSYMALGGLKGIRTLWGEPGGDVDDYNNPDAITRDIPHCVKGHYGGYFAEAFIKSSQLEHHDAGSVILSLFAPHRRSGGSEFKNFPDHLLGAHQQMHITGIKRSYDGGLRLMIALAVDNQAAQFLTGVVKNGHMDLVSEKESMEKQLAGMKRLAELNSKWMKIAYSAEEAREIIRDNKLAVILGVEYDQLGELPLGPGDQAKLEADYIWGLGARTVISVHATNNKLGGPAILNEPYNWLNDLLHRRSQDDHSSYTRSTAPAYFEIAEDKKYCEQTVIRGECVLHRLDPGVEFRVSLGYTLFNKLRLSPVIFPAGSQWPYAKKYATKFGHKNSLGLYGDGEKYIEAMMRRGMIVDLAHMSDKSIDDTFGQTGTQPDSYPTVMSHAHMRAQGLYEKILKLSKTTIEDYLPSEYDISDSHLQVLRQTGGVIGPFVEEPRIDWYDDPANHANDYHGGVDLKYRPNCGGSSINFGYSFAYAAAKVNTPDDVAAKASRVGMATDMTLIPMVSPRFGDHACDGYVPYRKGAQHKAGYSQHYRSDQQDPLTKVSYPDHPTGKHPPLQPYRMGQRVYDFNFDGLANYALLPDMLQDLKNLEDPNLGTLFQSAEGYLRMWEKVEQTSRNLRAGK